MNKNTQKILFIVLLGITITCIVILLVYNSASKYYNIDSGEGIDPPYLSGNISVEVDYMDGCQISQDELDDISDIFAGYGLNVTFIIDEVLLYDSVMDNSDIDSYYESRSLNTSSYIFFASEYVDSNVLGCIFNYEKIIIFSDSISDSFDGIYRIIAMQYVVVHELGHAYGCKHSDNKQDVMYPQISQAKIIVYPEPEFVDSEVLAELLD